MPSSLRSEVVGGGSSPARCIPPKREVPSAGRSPLSPARPLCPQEQPDLRQSSIVLFGKLTKFSEGNCEVFFEQILNGLVTLLLHLQDPKPEVVKVSAPLAGGNRGGGVLRLGAGILRGAELWSVRARCSLPSLCRRPASLLCACVVPTWAARGSATCSSTTCGRTGACTTGSS